jgi:hypothetical protein
MQLQTATAHHPKRMIISARTTGVLAAAATVRSPASAVEAETNDPRCPFAEAQTVDERRAQTQAHSQSGQPAADVPLAQDSAPAVDLRCCSRESSSAILAVASHATRQRG